MYAYILIVKCASDCVLQRYRLVARLDGHKGPINGFAFNNNSSLLASGGKPPAFESVPQLTDVPGDDEVVRVWDVSYFQTIQLITDRNRRWGQITCVKFINPDTASDWMCFGTGRGRFLVYRRHKKSVGVGV